MYKGTAKHVGMDLIDPGVSGDSEEEIKKKFELAANAKDYEFVFVHVKATDTAGHDGKWREKKEAIERVDKFIPLLREAFDAIAITGDHSTPWVYKGHSGHPVPLLMWGKYIRQDATNKFSEYDGIDGTLELRGNEVIYSLLNSIKKAHLKGN